MSGFRELALEVHVDTLRCQITTLTAERDALTAELAEAKAHVAALESNETHWISEVDQLRKMYADQRDYEEGIVRERDALRELAGEACAHLEVFVEDEPADSFEAVRDLLARAVALGVPCR